MKSVSLFLSFLAVIVPTLLSAQTRPQAEPRALVFTHVTVIDATGAAAKPGMIVVIAGQHIRAIGKSVEVPKDAQVVNATGKFLIPGLWDMHAHLDREDYVPLYVANGVTGVRFMDGDPAYRQWRRKVESGALLGPRMLIASKLIDGPHPVHPAESIAVGNEAEGRQTVLQVKRDGADFIKIYSLIPRAAYFAIADEAKKQSIVFAGHVPREVTAAEVSDAGQRSIEHLGGVAFTCSSREPEYRADLAKLQADLAALGAPEHYYLLLRRMEGKYLAAYDPQKCAPLFTRFIKNATWQVPTLDVVQSGAELADPDFVAPLQQYVPAQEGDPRKTRVYRNFTATDYANLKAILTRQLQIVGEMQRAGVGIMAGTDVWPVGFSLHGELQLMVQAGLTPMQALQTATLNPARYLGREKELGTIGVGKLADLVLLDADPLADIRNTQRIDAVVVDGKLLQKPALQKMLDGVKALNQAK